MIKTTLRKLGLGSCLLLVALFNLPMGVRTTYAAAVSCYNEGGVRTCVDTATSVVVSAEPIPTITPRQFANNPGSLFLNSGALGANVTSLIQNGVSQQQIAQTLAAVGTGNGITATQWNEVLGNISEQGNPLAGANLVTGLFSGAIDPQLGAALSGLNLGNQSLTGLLSNPDIQGLLSGMSPTEAGFAIDQLMALSGGQNIGDLGQLAEQIAALNPELAELLGVDGILEGLQGGLDGLGAAGGLDGLLGGGLGGGLGADAQGASNSTGTDANQGTCACTTCTIQIPLHHVRIQNEVTRQFEQLEDWMITTYFLENILPAMMLMAEQLTVAGIYQVEILGTFLDAKHQLETQRLFQQLTARAHKDYHPSEGMCTLGTTVRSLAMSDRRSNLSQIALASRMMQRQALSGENLAFQGTDSDQRSRLATFKANYCDQADNQNGLVNLCPDPVPEPGRRNIDVDYTRNIESRLTLEMNFADIPGTAGGTEDLTDDEQDAFALAANLYSHNIIPPIEAEKLGKADTEEVRMNAAEKYLDLRAIFAKRSVAQNSFAALVAMRASGDPQSAPYVKAVLRELGVADDDEINTLLGENPSYFAQMEILTKKLYQNPVFYTELYDKPANIERKGAALQAIGLMQDRDLYNSLIRSEATLSVLLETMLETEQERVTNTRGRINTGGGAR